MSRADVVERHMCMSHAFYAGTLLDKSVRVRDKHWLRVRESGESGEGHCRVAKHRLWCCSCSLDEYAAQHGV